MNEPQEHDESQDESLAAVPPTPIDEAGAATASNIGLGIIAITLAGAGAMVLVAGTMQSARGATRSAKLEWMQRQAQIEQAMKESQADNSFDVQPDDQNDAQPHADKTD